MSKVLTITQYTLISLWCLVLMIVFLSSMMGVKSFNVVSSSMEPTIYKGATVWARTINPGNIKSIREGDIIVFHDDKSLVTHRVKEVHIDGDNRYFVTKGDNNNVVDGRINSSQVKGKVVFYFQHLSIIMLIIVLSIACILVSIIIPGSISFMQQHRKVGNHA